MGLAVWNKASGEPAEEAYFYLNVKDDSNLAKLWRDRNPLQHAIIIRNLERKELNCSQAIGSSSRHSCTV